MDEFDHDDDDVDDSEEEEGEEFEVSAEASDEVRRVSWLRFLQDFWSGRVHVEKRSWDSVRKGAHIYFC